MNKKDILGIATKILGLYLFVMSLQTLPTLGMTLSNLRQAELMQKIWFLFMGIVPTLIMVAIALYFMINTHNILKWISDDESEGTSKDNIISKGIGKDAIQEIVFSGLGLFFAVNALSRLVIALLARMQQGSNASIAGIIVQLAIGIYLFFGSKQLVEILKKED